MLSTVQRQGADDHAPRLAHRISSLVSQEKRPQTGSVFVSAETLAIVISAVGIVLTLGSTMLAGFSWCVRRIDGAEHRLTGRIDAVADDVTELTITVARLEGPARRLLVPRR